MQIVILFNETRRGCNNSLLQLVHRYVCMYGCMDACMYVCMYVADSLDDNRTSEEKPVRKKQQYLKTRYDYNKAIWRPEFPTKSVKQRINKDYIIQHRTYVSHALATMQ